MNRTSRVSSPAGTPSSRKAPWSSLMPPPTSFAAASFTFTVAYGTGVPEARSRAVPLTVLPGPVVGVAGCWAPTGWPSRIDKQRASMFFMAQRLAGTPGAFKRIHANGSSAC